MTDSPKPWFGGGRLEGFRGGWAKFAFRGERGHHWREVTGEVPGLPDIAGGGRVREFVSHCGMVAVATKRLPAFGVGNFPVCRRCLKGCPAPTARDRLTFIEQQREKA